MIRPGRVLTTLLVGTLLAVMAGCSGESAVPPGVKAGPVPSGKAPATSSISFPLTLETNFGKVTIPKKPVRVMALGSGDADAVLALGVNPVGLVDWDQVGDPGVGPWVTKEVSAEPETVFGMWPWRTREKVPFGQIEKLKPDLILWTDGVLPEERKIYDRLARIAPTVAVLTGADEVDGSHLEQQTRQVAKVLGRVEQGEELLADLDAKFEKLKAEHPQFQGTSLTMADYSGFGFTVPLDGSPGFSFFERLGFTASPAIQAMDAQDSLPNDGYADVEVPWAPPGAIPDFDFAALDADLVLVDPYEENQDTDWIEKAPTFKSLPATRSGHTILVRGDAYPPISLALSSPSVLSTSWALDLLVPQMAEALA